MKAFSDEPKQATPAEDPRKHIRSFLRTRTRRPRYRSCSVDELRKFALDRRLITPFEGLLEHGQLIQMLLDADKCRQFWHFQSLPSELRTKVYEYYMLHIPPVVEHAVQPLLSRANRLIRSEMLPIFYQNYTFVIEFTCVRGWGPHGTPNVGSLHKYKFANQLFLETLAPENLADIRSWIFRFSCPVAGTYKCYVTFTGKVSEIQVEVKREHVRSAARRMLGDSAERQPDLEVPILEIFRAVAQREEKLKLKKEDIFEMRRRFEEAMKSQEDGRY